MWTIRRHEAAAFALVGLAGLLVGPQAARAQGAIHPSVTVSPAAPAPAPASAGADGDLLLQLEVFVNGRTLNLISPFTLRADGSLATSSGELAQIGLRVPPDLTGEDDIPLTGLPDLTFVYDAAGQSIRFTARGSALEPAIINAQLDAREPDPVRPPPGAVVNYTLFASGADAKGAGPSFDGVSGAFETRLFGHFGLVENSFVGRTGDGGASATRLDSSYTYEDPTGLRTYQAGDFISGGFSWTRPIRMAGIQVRRSFGLRPDLITIPLPRLTGTAATPSTLDLYVNSVRTLSADVQQGPFAIAHPPIIYGGGVASIVLRDALGRETVSATPFYASPELLARGLTDFSAEIGLARRNYATLSNDYDGRPAASVSWRRGLTDTLTTEAHAETVGSLVLAGGGAVATIRDWALVSAVVAGSRSKSGSGALVDLAIESRTPRLALLLRSQRTFGDYEDLASRTAVLAPTLGSDRRIFGQPRELDQASVSTPLPWKGGAVGASYIRSRRETDSSQLASLSFTQDLGPLSLFASASRDFDVRGSTGVFLGLNLPLGGGVNASSGASDTGGKTSTYAEVSKQGRATPGSIGWTARATEGQRQEQEGIVRYSAQAAHVEIGVQHADTGFTGDALVEGGLTLVGGGVHLSQRVDDSFALVEVGVPGVPVLRENRLVGVTDQRGELVVPHLSPFVANRIALDPSDLPVDAEFAVTSASVAPFSRVPVLVDMREEHGGSSAVVTFVDRDGRPLDLGSEVTIEGHEEPFVVGYDGDAFVQGLHDRNVAIVTTPDHAVCRATFDYRAAKSEQVRIQAVCRAEP